MVIKDLEKKSAIFVVFGGTGDLAHRKLMPALYNLALDNLIPENFAIVGIGRRDKDEEEYRHEICLAMQEHSRTEKEEVVWKKIRTFIHYYKFDFTSIDKYADLKEYLEELDSNLKTEGNIAFYMAVAPQYFETIIKGLRKSGLSNKSDSEEENDSGKGWRRIVIEKPFGKDLATASRLNCQILKAFSEKDIYRIDHYLGKEMIQNIMVMRFCNFIFESIWNNKFIDNIQITLSETLGVGSRGGYYEKSGAMRDMVQNHILQILTLVAMEPPINLSTDCIRSEKQKVLEAIEEITPEFLRKNVVFGQYGEGVIDGEDVPGYRQEEGISEDSDTETFVALKLHINNFRWSGTPFYLCTGKRLKETSAEIVIQFKDAPDILYFKDKKEREPNLLVLRIQPNVGVYFQFNTKDFMDFDTIVPTKMDTSSFIPDQGNTPEAYERLIYDILRGDSTLFSRWDEVEAAWQFADKIISYRENNDFKFPNYAAGSMGPERAIQLTAKDGRKWWHI